MESNNRTNTIAVLTATGILLGANAYGAANVSSGSAANLLEKDAKKSSAKSSPAQIPTKVPSQTDIDVGDDDEYIKTSKSKKKADKKVEADSNTANSWKKFTDNSLYANFGSESTGSETIQDDNVVDYTSKGTVPFGTLEALVGMKKNNNRIFLGVNGNVYKINFKDNTNGIETGTTKINHIDYAPGIGYAKDFKKADRVIKGADGKDRKVVDTLTHRLGLFLAYKGISDSIKQAYDIMDISKDRNAGGIEATIMYDLLNRTAKVVEVRAGVSAASGDSKTNVSMPTLTFTNETTVPYKRTDMFGVVKVHYNRAALDLMLKDVSEKEGDRKSDYTEGTAKIAYEINKYLSAGLGYSTILSGSADNSAYSGNRLFGGVKIHYDNENATYSSNKQPKPKATYTATPVATPTKTIPKSGKN
ncbi:hypothetical protein JXB27_04075 [Candidatus Woesearchaeota archaeon]|nr:hypothetical protein [Candidatus Woesearchaeota archaeon]